MCLRRVRGGAGQPLAMAVCPPGRGCVCGGDTSVVGVCLGPWECACACVCVCMCCGCIGDPVAGALPGGLGGAVQNVCR